LQLLKPFFSGYYLKRFKDFWNLGNLFLARQNSQSFRNDLGNSSDIKMCGNLFWVSQNTDFLECSFHSTAWTTPCFVRTTVEKIFAKFCWLRVFSISQWDCRKVHPYYSKNETWCCEGHITLKNFRILGNRPKRVSERSGTDSETLWRFSKGKKWISECSETLKRFLIVTKPETEKSFREKNPFPRSGNFFRFPVLLLSETL
jgi:hypothetical protein